MAALACDRWMSICLWTQNTFEWLASGGTWRFGRDIGMILPKWSCCIAEWWNMAVRAGQCSWYLRVCLKVGRASLFRSTKFHFSFGWKRPKKQVVSTRWELHGLELESRCQDLMQAVELSNDRQEVLAGMVVSKRDLQKEAPKKYQKKVFEEFKELEESRAKEALELAQKKHMLVKWEGERERATIL